jgi:hypothetical protein
MELKVADLVGDGSGTRVFDLILCLTAVTPLEVGDAAALHKCHQFQ